MLETQKYLLAGKSIDDLKTEYGIESTFHKELPLVILNYSQINSKPRNHPIVRECRALCLEVESWNLVYRSFYRFFNFGEYKEETDKFDWSKATIDEKVDGSLCIIYNYKDQWYGNTRGSFGLDKIGFEDFTWRDAFLKGMGLTSWDQLDNYLHKTIAYSCEFVSPWNKVVRVYKEPQVYLLSAFCGKNELSRQYSFTKESQIFKRPIRYNFNKWEQVYEYLDSISDPTFEGVVADDGDIRAKVKKKEYVALHHMRGEGDNLFNPKYLLQFILDNNTEELLTYYSEVTEKVMDMKIKLDNALNTLLTIWEFTKNIKVQKDFALAIQGKSPFSSMLFTARKTGKSVEEIWSKSYDLILKTLFKG